MRPCRAPVLDLKKGISRGVEVKCCLWCKFKVTWFTESSLNWMVSHVRRVLYCVTRFDCYYFWTCLYHNTTGPSSVGYLLSLHTNTHLTHQVEAEYRIKLRSILNSRREVLNKNAFSCQYRSCPNIFAWVHNIKLDYRHKTKWLTLSLLLVGLYFVAK